MDADCKIAARVTSGHLTSVGELTSRHIMVLSRHIKLVTMQQYYSKKVLVWSVDLGG